MIKDLVLSKDLKAIENKAVKSSITADESSILISGKWSEHKIQSSCCSTIKTFANIVKASGHDIIFLKVDNGRNHDNPTKDERENNPALYQAKLKKVHSSKSFQKAEGEQSGWPDVEIKMWKNISSYYDDSSFIDDEVVKELSHKRKSIYVEFKRIGGKIADNQQKWHEFLKEKGESAYFCNNLVYFEKVILKEIEEFLK